MNKHVVKGWARQLLDGEGSVRLAVIVRLFIFAGIIAICSMGVSQQHAEAASKTSDYCTKTYKNDSAKDDKIAACNDGANSANCNSYADIFGQYTPSGGSASDNPYVQACQNGAANQKPTNSTSSTPSPSPSSSSNSDILNNPQVQDLLDQANNLAGLLDVLHSNGKDSGVNLSGTSDDNYGSYVNGAGKQQPIHVYQCAANVGLNAANASSGLSQSDIQQVVLNTLKDKLGNSVTANPLSATSITNSITNALGSIGGGNSSASSLTSLLSTITSAVGNTSKTAGTASGLDSKSSAAQSVISAITSALGTTGGLNNNSTSVNSFTNALTSALGDKASSIGSGASSSIGSSSSSVASTSGTKCPAIIWINGGAWHADDGTAYCLATGSAQKNCQAGTNGGGDTSASSSDPVNIPPAGGGANARGYTVIEVSYRLGSSGVYYMFEDVMRGIEHVLHNASKYGIDASKVAVGGDSAGGSLAMRAVATGKSGAKAGIGWSAPTNAYTALFKSYKTFFLGMDHSTCVPTDLAGLANTTDLLAGGSGDIAEYGQGLASNDFSGLGIGQAPNGLPNSLDLSGPSSATSVVSTLTQVLTAAQYAADTGKNVESISKELESVYNGGGDPSSLISNLSSSGLASGVFNLSAKKLVECIDNFNVLSPALFASPDTPPTIMAGFENDDLIDPSQLTGMADKLHQLGVRSDAPIIIPGDDNASNQIFGAGDNHLGYDPRFVCATLNFIDSVMQPNNGTTDCVTGKSSKTDASTSTSTGTGTGTGGSPGTKQENSPAANNPCDTSSKYITDVCNNDKGNTQNSSLLQTCPGGGVIPTTINCKDVPAGTTYTISQGQTGDNGWQSMLDPNSAHQTQTQSWDSFYNNLTPSGTTKPYTTVPAVIPNSDTLGGLIGVDN